MNWYRWNGKDLVINLLVQTRASKNELVAVQGNAYKIRITAPPVDGRANEQIVRFLAKMFGVNNSSVQIITGTNNRHKSVRIQSPTLLPIPVSPYSNQNVEPVYGK